MAISVDYFVKLYEAIAEKNNVGQTLTPAQQNMFMNQAQLQLLSTDYQTFFKTKVVTNFLQTFLKIGNPTPVPASTGLISYPTDLQYVSSVSHYYNSLWYDSELIDSADWDKIQIPNSILKPTFRFTKYRQVDNGIEFAPKTIGIAKVNYFKTPTPPVWNYTIVNNEPVYNPTGSVDFECDTFNTNRLMAVFLQLVGINLKDVDIAGFANQLTTETQTLA